MLYSYTTKFKMEEEQLQLARSLEIPEEGEIEEIYPQTKDINPISNTKEDEEDLRQSMRARKRRKSVISKDKPNLINSGSEDENNNNNNDRLPIIPS